MKKSVSETLKEHAELIEVINDEDIKKVGNECIVIRIFKKQVPNFDEIKDDLGLKK